MLANPVVVNRPTGRMIRITKTTGRGSDYYGLCELCGGHMSECFTSRLARERRREDGSLYPDLAGVHVFAHKTCIDKLAERDKKLIPSNLLTFMMLRMEGNVGVSAPHAVFH